MKTIEHPCSFAIASFSFFYLLIRRRLVKAIVQNFMNPFEVTHM